MVIQSYVWLGLSLIIPLFHGNDGGQHTNTNQQQNINDPVALLGGFFDWFFKDAITSYTLVLTVATVALWRSSEKIWRQSERDFSRLERAYLILGFAFGGGNSTTAVFSANIRNYGRTMGVVKTICIHQVDAVPTGNILVYDETKAIRSDLCVMPNDPSGNLGYEVRVNGSTPYLVVGYVVYEDVVGKLHTTRTAVSMASGVFIPIGDDAWNAWSD